MAAPTTGRAQKCAADKSTSTGMPVMDWEEHIEEAVEA
jgi:hypothetical protein